MSVSANFEQLKSRAVQSPQFVINLNNNGEVTHPANPVNSNIANNPYPIGSTPTALERLQLQNQQQQILDNYISNDRLNKVIVNDYLKQTQEKKAASIAKTLLGLLVVSVFVFNKRARGLITKPFKKLFGITNEITTKKQFEKVYNNLTETLKQRNIKSSDTFPINLRLTDEATADKNDIVNKVIKLAKEYSNSNDGKPLLTFKLKENSEQTQQAIKAEILSGTKVSDSFVDAIENIGLDFKIKVGSEATNNNIDFNFMTRKMQGLSGSKTVSLFEKLFG